VQRHKIHFKKSQKLSEIQNRALDNKAQVWGLATKAANATDHFVSTTYYPIFSKLALDIKLNGIGNRFAVMSLNSTRNLTDTVHKRSNLTSDGTRAVTRLIESTASDLSQLYQ
jgi:hypothetical protein